MQYRLYTSDEVKSALDKAYKDLEMFLQLMQMSGKVSGEQLGPVKEMFKKYNDTIKVELKL